VLETHDDCKKDRFGYGEKMEYKMISCQDREYKRGQLMNINGHIFKRQEFHTLSTWDIY
jgi:hypothetical protein